MASIIPSCCPNVSIPCCQYVKDTIEINADGSVVEWVAPTIPSVGRVYHAADPRLNVGGGERRSAEGFAGSIHGGDFAHALRGDMAKICDAGLERALAGI